MAIIKQTDVATARATGRRFLYSSLPSEKRDRVTVDPMHARKARKPSPSTPGFPPGGHSPTLIYLFTNYTMNSVALTLTNRHSNLQ